MDKFRPNVCIVVRKTGSNLLLVCHRKGFPHNGGWQFPQGGIHKGKELVGEMKRELREEIGTDNVLVVKISPRTYSYTFAAGMKRKNDNFVGQIQNWILTEFSGSDTQINFNRQPAEFDAFEWVEAKEAIERIVDFKKQVYSLALNDLDLIDI